MTIDEQLDAMQQRLDRMANVNEYIIKQLERADTVRRRIADQQVELFKYLEVHDAELGALIHTFVEHRADGHGPEARP